MRGVWVLAVMAGACGARAPRADAPPPQPAPLRTPSDFAGIADPSARAAALFTEASRVLLHPRCLNCHPVGDSPTQGDHFETHDPPVLRGDDDRGAIGMRCEGCHQDANLELARVPGAPHWHLASRSMAWVGKTPADVCAQLKDPARNGGRTLAAVVDHTQHDRFIAWAWAPGHERSSPPGSQAAFSSLVAAWVEAGADCPRQP